jgi:trehalose 6-phosphate phosphatase
VLEIRPPIPFDKGRALEGLIEGRSFVAALYVGDDATDLDAFAALAELVEAGDLDAAVTVGVRSEDGPPEVAERADVVVDGIDGMRQVLAELDAR